MLAHSWEGTAARPRAPAIDAYPFDELQTAIARALSPSAWERAALTAAERLRASARYRWRRLASESETGRAVARRCRRAAPPAPTRSASTSAAATRRRPAARRDGVRVGRARAPAPARRCGAASAAADRRPREVEARGAPVQEQPAVEEGRAQLGHLPGHRREVAQPRPLGHVGRPRPREDGVVGERLGAERRPGAGPQRPVAEPHVLGQRLAAPRRDPLLKAADGVERLAGRRTGWPSPTARPAR